MNPESKIAGDRISAAQLPKRYVDVVVGSKNRVTTIVEPLQPAARYGDCPATGAMIPRLPFADDGLYRKFDVPCPICGLMLSLSSGRTTIPRHRDRR